MRKKIVFLTLAIVLFLFACSPKKLSEFDKGSKNIDFDISKSQLAKSFSRLEPYAEIKNKEFNPEKEKTVDLMVSLGLTESSGLSIDKITRVKNDLNIYVTSKFDQDKLELAIPQAVVRLDTKYIKDDLNSLELNIINDNHRPISLKLNLNDVVSKVNSQFKLSSSTTPTVDLFKENNEYIWSVNYAYIFDKEDKDLPLISFKSRVDANTGEILDHEKKMISKPIDSGSILNFADENSIIYKKNILDKKTEDTKEELWTYNLSSEEKNNIFTSDDQITSTQFNPSFECISFIETTENNSNLFLVSKDNKNATKISFDKNIKPSIANWIDDSNICIVEKNEKKSILYKYNINDDTIENLIDIPVDMHGLIFKDEKLLFTENLGDANNKEIYISGDDNDFHTVGIGFQPRFLNDNIIVYLEDMEGTDYNSLHFYDIESREEVHKISDNIQSFQIAGEDKLTYLSKKDKYSNYNLYLYDFKGDKLELLSQSLSNKAPYSLIRDIFYLNVNSPIEDDINQLIYPISIIK